ncbi:hypothetical protein [Nocardioides convexus]|uniref:hypothetical protein n=1 Tax=Nocardioides convexus TaxID=2712224 RepID=UPI0024181B54|nr:hypothetical protein [Nocardioides convexus]
MTPPARPCWTTCAGRLDDHTKRLSLYEFLEARDFPDPGALAGADLDIYLVLRGGLLMEQFWIRWLTEYLDAHTEENR